MLEGLCRAKSKRNSKVGRWLNSKSSRIMIAIRKRIAKVKKLGTMVFPKISKAALSKIA